MQAKWIVAIAAVAGACLAGLAGTVYFGVKLVEHLSADGRNWTDCGSKDEDTSLRGCSAILAAGKESSVRLRYAHNRKSVILSNRKQYDLAIEEAGKAIQIDPKNGSGYYNRAVNLLLTGDYDRALSDYNRALALNPANGPAWFGRGQVYVHREDYAHAIADYTEALKRNAQDGFAYIYRGSARAATGDLAEALVDCNQGLLIRPKDSNAFDCRAFTYLRMGKFDLALKDYDVAVAASPKNAGWLYCRGIAKRNLKDKAGAEADMAQARRMEPKVAERYRKYGIS